MSMHEISVDLFDALASSRADADAIETLRRAQLSRRLLLLRTVLERTWAVLGTAGPIRDVEQAFDLLAQTQGAAPHVVGETLLHPQVGGWAAQAIRLFGEPEADPAVLGGVVRHLGAIAASAAIRAGGNGDGRERRGADDFEVRVPVDHGRVRLPMLGCLRLEGDRAVGPMEAVVRRTGGRVQVVSDGTSAVIPTDPSDDAGSWRAVRRLAADADGRRLTVALDDADPYRLYHGLTPATDLDDGEVERWQGLFADAWQILVRYHASFAESIGRGLMSIVPLPASRQAGVSATSADAFGAAAISLPERATELAVALVHEYQHSKLSALLDLVPLYEDDGRLYYAPWRRDPRPIGGLLQGCYAHAGIAAFWRVQRRVATGAEATAATFEYVRWRDAVRSTADLLLRSSALTAAGRRFVAGIHDDVESWEQGEPDSRASRAARLSDLDHRTTWRLRNTRPDRAAVERLAAAWNAGRSAPNPAQTVGGGTAVAVRTTIAPGDFSPVDDARTRLLRRGFGDDRPDHVPDEHDADEADALLARGEDAAAASVYRGRLTADPSDVAAWSGYVVARALPASARSKTGVPPWLEQLISRPEVVSAVHREVVASGAPAPDPDMLAEWLSRSNCQSTTDSG